MLLYPRTPTTTNFLNICVQFWTWCSLSLPCHYLLSIKHFIMVATPLELTISALNCVLGNQLRFWIQCVNDGAGKKVLNKSGKVEDLWTRLVTHFGLNRTAPMVTDAPNSPLPLDKHIWKQQWDHLQQLGHKWVQIPCARCEFKLCTPSKGMWHGLVPLYFVICQVPTLFLKMWTPPFLPASDRISGSS